MFGTYERQVVKTDHAIFVGVHERGMAYIKKKKQLEIALLIVNNDDLVRRS